METKFNFKSQVCTDRFQSERLLALGLKKETADIRGVEGIEHTPTYAWSLHRLLSLIPREFEVDIILMYDRNYKMPIEMHILPDLSVIYTDLNKELYKGFYYTNIYDSLISCIEWQVEQGYFNKEYLNGND